MASKDMESVTKELVAFNSATISTDTTTAGNEIDTAGYNSCTFYFSVGTVTDGTYTPAITECATSGGTFTAVADADLLPDGTGQEAAAVLSASNGIGKLGYRGDLQYVKFSWVSASTSTGATSCTAYAILGDPTHSPVA